MTTNPSALRRCAAAASVGAVGLLSLIGLAAPASAAPSDGRLIYGVTSNGNRLVSFPANAPGTAAPVTPTGLISGLGAGETVVGLDFRPADGKLYALTLGQTSGTGNATTGTGRIYTVDTTTAVATLVPGSVTIALRGQFYDIDFNPVPNALRIISSAGQNLRITGATLNGFNGVVGPQVEDGALAYAAGDVNAARTPRIGGIGYLPIAGPAGQVVNGGATTLFDVDYSADALSVQNPPNAGTLTTVGPLGVNVTNLLGFDFEVDSTGYVSGQLLDADGGVSGGSTLFTINRTTGALTTVGDIAGDLLDAIAITTPASPTGPTPVVPEFPVAALGPLAGLGLAGAVIVFRRRRFV